MTAVRIDARGMRCPWPVIRIAKAFREGADHVVIDADDPIAPVEIAALAEAKGWSLLAEKSGNRWQLATDPVLLRSPV